MEVVDNIQEQPRKFPRLANGRSSDSNEIGLKGVENIHTGDEKDKESKRDGGITAGVGGGGLGGADDETNRLRGWHHSRIIRVSRASGGKDRHSKVWTSKGLRDRRVRLSVATAIQFYDLQDRLGFGGGVEAPGGRVYREYHLEQYSPWLRKRIKDPRYWLTIRSCLLGSKTCAQLASWTPLDYLQRDMSPIQSGCCKPPTACNYDMMAAGAMVSQDPDCYRWNNAPTLLCYECDSCKAGVLENVRRDWHKLSVLNVVVVILLIGVYCVGCCAFRNTKRAETDYPYGHNQMTKVRPRWDYYWWRWLHDKKEQLY